MSPKIYNPLQWSTECRRSVGPHTLCQFLLPLCYAHLLLVSPIIHSQLPPSHRCQLSLFQRDSLTFLRAVPPIKDLRISIVVPPTWKCPYFWPTNPTFLLLVLAGWQLCLLCLYMLTFQAIAVDSNNFIAWKVDWATVTQLGLGGLCSFF